MGGGLEEEGPDFSDNVVSPEEFTVMLIFSSDCKTYQNISAIGLLFEVGGSVSMILGRSCV